MTSPVLNVLDDPTAVALLKGSHLGRLAFAHEHWPVILPVNFAFEDPTVIIRTVHGSKLAEAPFTAVAFEVVAGAALSVGPGVQLEHICGN